MSDAPSANNSSGDDPPADATPPEPRKPKSSRVGRIVIGILLLVLVVEAAAHIRVTWAKSKLTAELARSEVEAYEVTREAVKQILGGREPDFTKRIHVDVGDELYDVYYFNGLLKRRVLCVHYGVEGTKDEDESQREMMEVLTVVPEVVLFDDQSHE